LTDLGLNHVDSLELVTMVDGASRLFSAIPFFALCTRMTLNPDLYYLMGEKICSGMGYSREVSQYRVYCAPAIKK
jgi:hypothetical protein